MAKNSKKSETLTIKDLKTPAERSEFIEMLQMISSPEEMEGMQDFARAFLDFANAVKNEQNDPQEDQDLRIIREVLEAVEKNEELKNMTVSEAFASGKLKAYIEGIYGLRKKETTPSLPSVINYSFMNDLSAWEMVRTDGTTLDGQLSVWWEVLQKKNNKTIPVYISLLYDGDDVKISRKFTAFDRDVIDAISTIFFYWRLVEKEKPLSVTPTHIWRIMNGKQLNDSSVRPKKRQLDRICQSMDKLRFTKITIECLQELKECGFAIDDRRFSKKGGEDYLINAQKIYEFTANGSRSVKYIVQYEPLLFTYNRMKDRVLYVPLEYMDTSNEAQNSESLQEFRSYLVRRIKSMINGSLNSNRILLQTIYRDTGIEPPASRLDRSRFTSESSYSTKIRQEAKKDREKIEAVFSSWITMGFIKGFSPFKKNGAIVGYDISYVKENGDTVTLEGQTVTNTKKVEAKG